MSGDGDLEYPPPEPRWYGTLLAVLGGIGLLALVTLLCLLVALAVVTWTMPSAEDMGAACSVDGCSP